MQVGAIQGGSTALAAVSKVSNTYFDPKDTNQDGIVSASEELAYALQHPEQSTEESSLTQYTQSGALNAGGQTNGGSLNLLA